MADPTPAAAPDAGPTTPPALEVRDLSVAYRTGPEVLSHVDLAVPAGRVTVLVGANGSGKSTLLRAMAGSIEPGAGSVLLEGRELASMPRRHVARRLTVLPQQPSAPDGISVRGLSEFGRHPHGGFLRRDRAADRAAVDRALTACSLDALGDRPLAELSGGQRQRAWIAMALAQETPVILLDEPTTYLDVAHQLDVLDLLVELNRAHGTTVVMVLHDLNHAAHYADHVVAMHAGTIRAAGPPGDVLEPGLLRDVFGVRAVVVDHPVTGSPLCLPLPRSRAAAPGRLLPEAP